MCDRVSRTALNWVAARKLLHPARDNFIDLRGDRARLAFLVSVDFEAVGQRSTRLANVAVQHGVTKDASLPAVDEIGVESVASRVTHGENPRIIVGTVHAIEYGDIKPELDEDVGQDVRVSVRAIAAIWVVSHWIRDVGGRVAKVECLAIPAVGEMDAASEAIITVGEAIGEASSNNIWRAVAVPLGDALTLHGSWHGPEFVVASEHAEILREFLDRLVVHGAIIVVNLVLRSLGNLDERLVLRVLEVEFRKPVHGFVGFDVDRAAVGLLERFIAHSRAEGIGADDGVDVAANLAGEHHGVETFDDKGSASVLDEVVPGILAILSSSTGGENRQGSKFREGKHLG